MRSIEFLPVSLTLVLVCTGLYATADGKEKRQEKRFCGFYLIFCGMVTGLNFAGNLITFYFFWEWMSVASIPLVLHRQTREAYGKGLRYILASFCGSAMVLTGTFFLFRFANTLTFAVGGVLDQELKKGREGLLLLVCLLMLAGILVKAGVVPFISWVPGLFEKIPLSVDTLLAGSLHPGGTFGCDPYNFYPVWRRLSEKRDFYGTVAGVSSAHAFLGSS